MGRCMSVDVCKEMYTVMRKGVCMGMFIDACIDMCMDRCIHMCMDMCMDMCMNMCMDMCRDMCRMQRSSQVAIQSYDRSLAERTRMDRLPRPS